MKKTIIALVVGILMALQFVFAAVNPYSKDRILYTNTDAAPFQLLLVNYDLQAWNEVVVCVNADKSNVVVIADLLPGSTVDYKYIAQKMLDAIPVTSIGHEWPCQHLKV